MEPALIASTLVLGLAGAPHCTAMCAAPCTAIIGRGDSSAAMLAFHGARLASYALAGAVVAGGVASLSALSLWAPALRPLWAMVHATLLVLGLWLLWQGRQPALLARLGRQPLALAMPAGWQVVSSPGVGAGLGAGLGVDVGVDVGVDAGAPRSRNTSRAALAGGLWAAWPCGLLQSALLVAALSSSAAGGAVAMAAFAAASSAGLLFAPLVWRWLGRSGGGRAEAWALRGAGLLMALMSGWALTEGVWHRVTAYCLTL